MADLSWLRSGRRSRTPTMPRSPTTSERDPNREPQMEDHRRSEPSRIPSYLTLDTRASFSPEPPTGGSDAGILVREQDKVWYNPSLDQMIETLQVFFMTRGTIHSLPVAYNSYVQYLIEALAEARAKSRTADTACAQAKQLVEEHLAYFNTVADEWLERESQYKAEIKRLEVLLSKTSRSGLEAVTLARTNSVVDRTGPQVKHFATKLKDLGKKSTKETHNRVPHETDQWEYSPLDATDGAWREEGQPGREKVPLPKILDEDNDFLMSEKIRREDAVTSANAAHAEIRRPRRAWAATREGDHEALAAAAHVGGTNPWPRPQPLFSDDIPLTPGASGEQVASPEAPALEEMCNTRQMLQNLLDCEPSHGGSNDVDHRSRNISMLSGQSAIDRASEGFSTSDLDVSHRRDFSGFSFVPGDDAFPVFTSSEAEDGMMKSGHEGDDSIELRQYEPVRQEDDVDISAARASRGQSSLMADLASSLQADRWLPTAETGRLQNSTSSVNTVVRETARGASHESPKARHGMERNYSSRGSQNADLVLETSSMKQETQAQDSARIAAVRAVAKSKAKDQGPET
ncbi:hypothetical protein F4779DRAFT_162442 [Xylariaceae sp. FL0662B]|nr:hypothetical protein F4779DRAFT_162442 [Xylariaceae sp. FL0662B]